MDIKWKNVSVVVRNRNDKSLNRYVQLLENSNGCVQAGNVMGIIGPSGSGKTTLLKALVGIVPNGALTSGIVEINGEERSMKNWKGQFGYVEQDDIFSRNMSIYEAISNAVYFRKRKKIVDLEEKISDVASVLNITDVLHNKFCALSGGQRKRALIAIELLSDTNVLFLDEPTSGLDASNCIQLLEYIRALAKKEYKTIILTIHQSPMKGFKQLDSVVLLKKSYTIFSGTTEDCIKTFKDSKHFSPDPDLSFPEFLSALLLNLEGCPEQEKRCLELKDSLIETHGSTNIPQEKMKRDNDTIRDYKFNLKDAWTLLKRRIKLEYSSLNTIGFLLFIMFFSIGFLVFLFEFSFIMSNRMKKMLNNKQSELYYFTKYFEGLNLPEEDVIRLIENSGHPSNMIGLLKTKFLIPKNQRLIDNSQTLKKTSPLEIATFDVGLRSFLDFALIFSFFTSSPSYYFNRKNILRKEFLFSSYSYSTMILSNLMLDYFFLFLFTIPSFSILLSYYIIYVGKFSISLVFDYILYLLICITIPPSIHIFRLISLNPTISYFLGFCQVAFSNFAIYLTGFSQIFIKDKMTTFFVINSILYSFFALFCPTFLSYVLFSRVFLLFKDKNTINIVNDIYIVECVNQGKYVGIQALYTIMSPYSACFILFLFLVLHLSLSIALCVYLANRKFKPNLRMKLQ